MSMEAFRQVQGAAAALPIDDVNTDQIIPSAYLKDMNADLGRGLLAYMRRAPDGQPDTSFVLEKAQYRQAPILLVGRNFGCGSSREHAVWALRAFGIRCVIGPSLAEFFRENCLKNGMLPVVMAAERFAALMERARKVDGHAPFTVDLESCQITGPEGFSCSFEIAPGERKALLEGLDDIGLTLKHLDAIVDWEARVARERPFMQARIDELFER